MNALGHALWLLELPLLGAVAAFTGYLVLLTAAALAARRPAAPPGPPRTRFGVLVPAHDEAATLPTLLGVLAGLEYPRALYEVIVVADHCTDETAQLARRAGARVLERTEGRRGGKGFALGWAFAALVPERRHDAFVVLDADSRPDRHLLTALDAALRRGARAAQAYCSVANPGESWRTALMAADLALVHYLRPLGREAVGASAGLQGNGSCLSAQALRRVRWETRSVAEDQEYHLRLVLHGLRVAFVPEAQVRTVMEPTLGGADGQELRWEGGRLAVARAQLPALLAGAWRTRSWPCLEAALDLTTPPLALLGAGTALAALVHGVAWLAGAPGAPAVLWGMLVAGQASYVVGGCALARVPARAYLALALFAPLYAIHKVWICARVGWRGTAVWIPTPRRAG
ncbi:MAG TPA: glycosyltransferase family 2 protein [Methylomirabilota bacterium]|jgi:cellulose synthase/poly-beta-1,6-N-acetylglucosamine synthase-like glycosyltransferase|nr:glycosyltransferase family 2 protein [Methylomirabilota bacterium]